MTKNIRRDAEQMWDMFLRMAGHAEEAVHAAVRALAARDPLAARSVAARDDEIDALENAVQEECLRVLALHQPVAVDLRRVHAVLLAATDLERMGDLAVGIAERAAELSAHPAARFPERLDGMTARTTAMVRRAMDAFVAGDAAAARSVIRDDDAVDADNDALLDEVTGMMRGGEVEAGLALYLVVRHLERIADHATNVAECAVFLAEGVNVRHSAASAPSDPGRPRDPHSTPAFASRGPARP